MLVLWYFGMLILSYFSFHLTITSSFTVTLLCRSNAVPLSVFIIRRRSALIRFFAAPLLRRSTSSPSFAILFHTIPVSYCSFAVPFRSFAVPLRFFAVPLRFFAVSLHSFAVSFRFASHLHYSMSLLRALFICRSTSFLCIIALYSPLRFFKL